MMEQVPDGYRLAEIVELGNMRAHIVVEIDEAVPLHQNGRHCSELL